MYQTSKIVVVVAVVVVLGLSAHHMVQAGEAIKPDQLPKAVQAKIAQMYPKAEITKAEKEDEGGVTLYEAKLKTKKGVLEVVIAEDGALVEIETLVTAAQLPKAVKAAVKKEAKGAKIVKCEKMELHAEVQKGKLVALKKPRVEYEVKYKVGDKVVEIKMTADGKMTGKEEAEDEEKDDEDEQKLTLDQVPAAVKATILKEAGNNKLKEIELETEDGKKVYGAEWVADGKEIDIKVAPDGKLLKKEVESADKDDDEKDDKDDDD